jgi:hypothetical protein
VYYLRVVRNRFSRHQEESPYMACEAETNPYKRAGLFLSSLVHGGHTSSLGHSHGRDDTYKSRFDFLILIINFDFFTANKYASTP